MGTGNIKGTETGTDTLKGMGTGTGTDKMNRTGTGTGMDSAKKRNFAQHYVQSTTVIEYEYSYTIPTYLLVYYERFDSPFVFRVYSFRL